MPRNSSAADSNAAGPRERYRLLHNHLDLVLTRALRRRGDVVVARVPMPLDFGDTTGEWRGRRGRRALGSRYQGPPASFAPGHGPGRWRQV